MQSEDFERLTSAAVITSLSRDHPNGTWHGNGEDTSEAVFSIFCAINLCIPFIVFRTLGEDGRRRRNLPPYGDALPEVCGYDGYVLFPFPEGAP